MKKWQLWGATALAAAVVTIGALSIGFAQPEVAANGNRNAPGMRGGPGPGGRQGMGPMGGPMMPGGPRRLLMHAEDGNLYVLQANKLVKYTGAALREEGTVTLENVNDNRPRLGAGPADFLINGDDVLLVAGGTFYRIDGNTMKVAKQIELPIPDADEQDGMRPRLGPPPQLELGGRMLFVALGNRLYSIDIAAGKVTGQTELELPARPPR